MVPHIKEEHRFLVFEKWLLRRMFEPKREEVAGGWRQWNNEELKNLCSSPNKLLR
jgi:hypothetical protein